MDFLACDRAPAVVGHTLETVETPAAVVCIPALRANITRAIAKVRAIAPGVTIRPHAKSHKCPQIAALQIALSDGLTVGVCCQKVIEAEAMAAYGITNILLSNQVVDDTKIARLAALCRGGAAISVLVDSADNAHQLARIAKSHGTTFGVLIEVDVGQHRCGVPSVSTAVDLARVVHGHTELRLLGIQAYHGAAQHARSLSERRSIGKLRVRAYLYDTLQCLRATRSLSPHELTETARLEHQQLRILVVGCLLCPCS